MSFLIKVALLVTVVIFCIPADPDELARSGEARRTIGVFDAYGLAQATYDDVSGFCGRNPAACDTGGAVMDTFAAKARTGLRYVQAYIAPAPKPATAQNPPAVATPVRAQENTGSIARIAWPASPPRKPQPL